MEEMSSRSAEEVLDDHLRESRTGSIDDDLPSNYAPDVVILCRKGIFHGHGGMRQSNTLLMQDLPHARFSYGARRVAGEMGFLEWSGRASNGVTAEGADSYLIRDGKIVAQTIHYDVHDNDRTD
jgi:hypothetical protein